MPPDADARGITAMPDDRDSRAFVTDVTPHDPTSVPPERYSRERASARGRIVRTTPWVQLEAAAASVRGRRRPVNEDWHSSLDGESALFVVADGVGGGAMAARASRELVAQLHATLDHRRVDAGTIRLALLRADREVRRSIASHTRASGAATVALCAGRGWTLAKWLVAWVGDCRVYRIGTTPGAPAEQLTADDTYRRLRESPPPGGSPDDPARMVGNGAVLQPNVKEFVLRRGEMLVLLSDGVHKHVEPGDLSRILCGSAPLVRRCWRLVALARAHGSTDDATVLALHRAPGRMRLTPRALGALTFAGFLVALAATLMVML
jgi:serine/threonine protein phosphatase PrpC